MKRMNAVLVAAAVAFALTGCGGTQGDHDGEKAASEAIAAMPADWKATDACSFLDKAEVAKILKQEITDAQVGLVHEPGTTDAGTSECTFIGSDGGAAATLMTRWSPIGDNTPDAIAAARSTVAATLKGFSDKPIEDVPGLGKAAFFAPGIDQLNVFLDDSRMIMVSVRRVPDGASGKETVIALAKRAGA